MLRKQCGIVWYRPGMLVLVISYGNANQRVVRAYPTLTYMVLAEENKTSCCLRVSAFLTKNAYSRPPAVALVQVRHRYLQVGNTTSGRWCFDNLNAMIQVKSKEDTNVINSLILLVLLALVD